MRPQKTFRPPAELAKALQFTSIELGKTHNQLIAEALIEYLPKVSSLPIVHQLCEVKKQDQEAEAIAA